MTKAEIKDLYKVMFTEYPDVVDAEQLGKMLGGISIKTVYRLLKEGIIKSLHVGREYKIPRFSSSNILSTSKNPVRETSHT